MLDLTRPFRGSAAVAAGVVTRKQLRGSRFHRLFADVYVSSSVTVDLALRSRGAYLLAAGRGVLGGFSAAELLGGSCGPADAPAELIVPGRCQAKQAGLRVSRAVLLPDEALRPGLVCVTTPLRTAFDLARRAPLVEAVVAVDALARAGGFAPRELIAFGYRHLGARGSDQLPEVVRLANPLADSPMETRIRIGLHDGGLPAPVVQHPVGPYWLDLAYPQIKLGIEYDGRDHLEPARVLRDLDRQAYFSSEGWRILRFRPHEVYRPRVLAARVQHVIAARAT